MTGPLTCASVAFNDGTTYYTSLFSDGAVSPATAPAYTLTVSGNVTLAPGMSVYLNGALEMTANGSTLQSYGKQLNNLKFSQTASHAAVNLYDTVNVNNLVLNNSNKFTLQTSTGGQLSLTTGTLTNTVAATQGVQTFSLPVIQATSGTWTIGTTTGGDSDNLTISSSGVLSGAGPVILSNGGGTGALTLSCDNSSYSGGITLNSGLLNINHANALGTGAFTLNGGSFDNITGSTLSLGTVTPESWAGSFTFVGTNSLNTGSGAVTLNCTPTVYITNPSNTLTIGGVIGGGYGVTQDGPGILNFANQNTYTGATTVNGGTLQAGASQSGSNGAFGSNSAVTMSNTATAKLDLNGYSNQIGSLSGGNTSPLYGNVTLGAATLTIATAGSAAYAGQISGAGGLTMAGAGTQTLSGTNTYTGQTSINTGKLLVSGTISSATGGVSVSGALGGTGTIAGKTNVLSGGSIDTRDNSCNTLTFSSTATPLLSGSANSNLYLDYNSTNIDLLSCTGASGTVNLANMNLNLNLIGGVQPTEVLTLINCPNGCTISGTFANTTNLPPGYAVYYYNTSVIISPTIPTLLSAVTSDPTNSNTVLTAGDIMTLTFDRATNQSMNGNTYNGTQMNGFLILNNGNTWGDASDSWGLSWSPDGTVLTVTSLVVGNASISQGYPPYTVTVSSTANIQNATSTSANCTTANVPLTGNWGILQRFWVGGTGTFSDPTTVHWAVNSGAAGGATAPTSTFIAYFDGNSGSGTCTIDSGNSVSGLIMLSGNSMTLLNTATLVVGGTGVSVVAGTLCGTGTISGTITATGGVVAAQNPMGTPASLTITGDLNLQSGSTLSVLLNGTTAGTNYSQLTLGDVVNLSSCTLNASDGNAYPFTGYPQLIILNTANGLSGTFSGYAEGATVFTNANAYRFKITYAANGGAECVMIPRHQTATVFTGAGVLNAKQ
jgi:autotransporter-associated beta strand protein